MSLAMGCRLRLASAATVPRLLVRCTTDIVLILAYPILVIVIVVLCLDVKSMRLSGETTMREAWYSLSWVFIGVCEPCY
jgi:hypothetical protein